MPLTQVNNLITTHTFKDQEYLIKFKIVANNMELNITEKQVGEEWQGTYDRTYIENLTTRTGNFKSFDIFMKMLKSGLLKTSRSIKLDLITFEDLRHLRTAHVYSKLPNINVNSSIENRRYLIITYSVEFDKIMYPLTLEYCGPPDVNSLVATIRRLENELKLTKEALSSNKIKTNIINDKDQGIAQKRVKELTMENMKLVEEVRQLRLKSSISTNNKINQQHSKAMASGLTKLQLSILDERKAHNNLVDKLKQEKAKLQKEIEALRKNECSLKQQLVQSRKSSGISSLSDKRSNTSGKSSIVKSSVSAAQPKTKKTTRSSSQNSRASSACNSITSRGSNSSSKEKSKYKNGDSSYSSQSHASSYAQSEKRKFRLKRSEHEYKKLENRLNEFQNLFKTNLKK